MAARSGAGRRSPSSSSGLTLAQVGGIPLGSFLGYTAGWRATFWMVAVISPLWLSRLSGACRDPYAGDDAREPRAHLISPVLMPAILVTASMMGAAWILFTYFAPLLEDRMGYGRNGVTFMLVLSARAQSSATCSADGSPTIGPARALIVVTIGLIVDRSALFRSCRSPTSRWWR